MHPLLLAGALIRSPSPLLAILDFKSFPLEKAAIQNYRKDLWNFAKYFTGH